MYVERFKSGTWVVTRTILLVGLIFIVLYPILVKISTVFKDKADIYNPTVVWIPERFTLDNLRIAYEIMDYWPTLFNTFGLSAVTMLLQLASCALAGYGFAKLKTKWGHLLFAGVVLTILIPPQTFIVPLYLHFRYFDFLGLVSLVSGERGVNLINTYWPFLLTAATGNALKSGLYIYIFRQFFLGLSKELEEAAFVDGAGVFGSFSRIVLPTSVPAIVTVALFSFVWQWNDTFFTGNFLTESQVLSKELLALPSNVGNYLLFEAPGASLSNSANIDPFYASMLVDTGLLLAILPLIVMYLFVQRFFVESIERTGIVG